MKSVSILWLMSSLQLVSVFRQRLFVSEETHHSVTPLYNRHRVKTHDQLITSVTLKISHLNFDSSFIMSTFESDEFHNSEALRARDAN